MRIRFWNKRSIEKLEADVEELKKEIDNLGVKLNFQIGIDAYKDDLIRTLEKLLIYKGDVISGKDAEIERLVDENLGLRNR